MKFQYYKSNIKSNKIQQLLPVVWEFYHLQVISVHLNHIFFINNFFIKILSENFILKSYIFRQK